MNVASFSQNRKRLALGRFMSTILVGEQNQGPVKLTSCGFWPVAETQEQVVKLGPSTLVLTSCHFAGWDSGNKGAACLRAAGGRLAVTGCEFMAEGKQPIMLATGRRIGKMRRRFQRRRLPRRVRQQPVELQTRTPPTRPVGGDVCLCWTSKSHRRVGSGSYFAISLSSLIRFRLFSIKSSYADKTPAIFF